MEIVNNIELGIRVFSFILDHGHIPYIAEVALYMPVLVLIHLWMLFSPDSEYWILGLPCFFLRYGGSLFILGTLNYTRSQIVCFYVLSLPLLFFGSVINSCLESVQNLASEESTFQCTILLLATVVLSLIVLLYITRRLVTLPWWSAIAILTLISFVFWISLTIFVYFVYWSSILIFTAIALWDVFGSAYQLSRNVGQNEDVLMQYVAAFLTNRFTKFPVCHIFSLLFFSYYTYAIISELQNGMPLQALVSTPTLINIIGKWCTSFIVLNSIFSLLVQAGNIIIIKIRYYLIYQREDMQWLLELIDTGNANNTWICFHSFAVHLQVMNLHEEKRGDAISVLLQFTVVGVLGDIWLMFEPFLTQLGAHAAERQLRVYIGVVVFIMSFIVVSILVPLNIANQFELGMWPVLFTSECLLLVSRALLTFMEYTVNMISWSYDMDLTKTQNIIDYICLSKGIGVIICSILEGYHKLFFPLFSQNTFWFLVHAMLFVLAQLFVITLILLPEYIRHVQRTESQDVVNTLPIATSEQLENLDDDCAICLDEIRDGLVTPCKHIFHRECLRRACAIRQLCPLCNQLVFQNTNVKIQTNDLQELLDKLSMMVNRSLQVLGLM